MRFKGAKILGLVVTCLKVNSCHIWKKCGKPWIHTGYPYLRSKVKKIFQKFKSHIKFLGTKIMIWSTFPLPRTKKNMRHQC